MYRVLTGSTAEEEGAECPPSEEGEEECISGKGWEGLEKFVDKC